MCTLHAWYTFKEFFSDGYMVLKISFEVLLSLLCVCLLLKNYITTGAFDTISYNYFAAVLNSDNFSASRFVRIHSHVFGIKNCKYTFLSIQIKLCNQ